MSGEYISREAAIKAVCDCSAHTCKIGECFNGCTEAKALSSIPAADVVEVVRCRECVAWQSGWKPRGAKAGTHFCAVTGLCKEANWFCADGERKDGGQDESPTGPYDLLYEEGGANTT